MTAFALPLVGLLAAGGATELYELDLQTGQIELVVASVAGDLPRLSNPVYSGDGAIALSATRPPGGPEHWLAIQSFVWRRETGEVTRLGPGRVQSWVGPRRVLLRNAIQESTGDWRLVSKLSKVVLVDAETRDRRALSIAGFDHHWLPDASLGVRFAVPGGKVSDGNAFVSLGWNTYQTELFGPLETTGDHEDTTNRWPLPIPADRQWRPAALAFVSDRDERPALVTLVARQFPFEIPPPEDSSRQSLVAIDVRLDADDRVTVRDETLRTLDWQTERHGGLRRCIALRAAAHTGEVFLSFRFGRDPASRWRLVRYRLAEGDDAASPQPGDVILEAPRAVRIDDFAVSPDGRYVALVADLPEGDDGRQLSPTVVIPRHTREDRP